MNTPAFYKPPPKWHSLIALVAALAIEAAAVAAASLQKPADIPTDNGGTHHEPFIGVIVEDPPEAVPPSDAPPEIPPPPSDEITDFTLTEPTPPPRKSATTRVTPNIGTSVSKANHPAAGRVSFIAGHTRMIRAPYPGYPFEARRARQTGTGKYLLRFDANGSVTNVETILSTGSAFLDQAAVRALEQWRCPPGVYESVYVPITFTLQGAQL